MKNRIQIISLIVLGVILCLAVQEVMFFRRQKGLIDGAISFVTNQVHVGDDVYDRIRFLEEQGFAVDAPSDPAKKGSSFVSVVRLTDGTLRWTSRVNLAFEKEIFPEIKRVIVIRSDPTGRITRVE